MTWYVERADEAGNWTTLMASPHRIGIADLRGPPGPAYNNQTTGADYMNNWPTPGNKTVFAGKQGWQARVRYNSALVELYDWDRIPENELDSESDLIWGWKLVADHKGAIPFDVLHPLSFVG